MGLNTKYRLAAVIVCLVGLGLVGANLAKQSPDSSSLGSGWSSRSGDATNEREMQIGGVRSTQPIAESRSNQSAGQTPNSLSALSSEQKSLNYRHKATCAKVRRLDAFMSAQVEDPNSWVNNRSKNAGVTDEEVRAIEKNIALVKSNRQRCMEDINGSVEDIVALYDAALAAGLDGDRDAALCYVLAPWPATEGGNFIPQVLAQYKANASALIEDSIEAGDWRMVDLLIGLNASPTTGLLANAIVPDRAKAYAYAKLKRLGATGNLAARMDKEISMLQNQLPANKLVEADQWAAQLYSNHFSTSGPSADSTRGCDF